MRKRGVALALAVLAALTACAGSGDVTASPSASASDLDQGLAFAQCMRDNGVPDFPDPDPDGGFSSAAGKLDEADAQKALDACRDLLPAARQQQQDPEQQEKLLKMAQCMREQGYDVPDPDPDNPGGLLGDIGVDRTDPKVQQAIKTCQEKVGS
jgi:hypothetical protein